MFKDKLLLRMWKQFSWKKILKDKVMYGVHIRNLALSIVAVQHVKHVKNNNVFLPYQMFNFQQ